MTDFDVTTEVRAGTMKRVWRIVGYTLGLTIFTIAVIAGITQTKLFKDRLRVILASVITTNTNGSLELGTIRGNLVTGFTIDSLKLFIDGKELVSTGSIAFDYDLFSIPRETILIHRLVIQNPRVVLERGTDSTWNIDRFGKPAEPTEQAPFTKTIRVNELKIVNGAFRLRDDLSLNDDEHGPSLQHHVEYHDVNVANVNFTCSGQYGQDNVRIAIEHLSLESLRPDFKLQRLKGDFSISPKGAEVKNLLVETSRSEFKLSASMRQFNLLAGIDIAELGRKPTTVTFVGENIDLGELKSFIAPLEFLNGSASVLLEAEGEFGNLSIRRLNVQTYNTLIRLTGAIQNLHDPDRLFISADIRDSRVLPSDANRLLPPFQIPEFEKVGVLSLSAKYVGTPLNFQASMTIKGNIGTAEAEVKLDLNADEMEYDASFAVQNLHLPLILDADHSPDSVTARGSIRGWGTSLRSMAAKAHISVDTCLIERMELTKSDATIDVGKQRVFAFVRLESREMKSVLHVKGDLRHPEYSSYSIEGDIANLDLSKLLNDNHFRSSLSLSVQGTGSGSNVNDLTGTIGISFGSSTFQTHEFSDERLEMKIDQTSRRAKELTVSSPVADLRLAGEFDIGEVIDFVQEKVNQAEQSINAGPGRPAPHGPLPRIGAEPMAGRRFAFDYAALVKNLRPLSILVGGVPFNGRGTIQGKAMLDESSFSATCSLTVNELFAGTVDRGVLLHDALWSMMLSSPTPSQGDFLHHLRLDARSTTQHGIVNNHTFDNTAFLMTYQNGDGVFRIESAVDSLLALTLSGKMDVSSGEYHFSFDSVALAFEQPRWTNEGPFELSINAEGIHLSNCVFISNTERLVLEGAIDRQGNVAGKAAVRQLALAGLGYYLRSPDLLGNQGFGGNLDAELNVRGSFDSPVLDLTISCEELFYRGGRIGRLAGVLSYGDVNLNAEIFVDRNGSSASGNPNLEIKGYIPINLAFTSVEKRFPDKPMTVTISSDGFELGVLDPLLTTFDDVRGRVTSNIQIEGTPNQPTYAGSVSLSEVRFLFVPNDMVYFLDGKFEAAGDRISLVDFRVANDPRDRPAGTVTVTGSLAIRDFTINSFDLTANGQLLLMKETTRRTMRSMYGTLFAEIGPRGLRYYGTFDHSNLRATIYIRNANLVFPPTREITAAYSETSLNLIEIDDTTQRDVSKERITEEFFGEHTSGPANGTKPDAQRHRTIWDGMVYDVEIETQGTTDIRMVFNQATNEELFAGLEGRVVLQRGDRGPNIAGRILVSDRSYYTFFKRFDASGSMTFLGSPENPELDIAAKYEGIRTPVGEQDTTEQKVVVVLTITGTRYEPKLNMSMTVDGVERAGDIQSDAIPFILTGKFRDDLTSREKSDMLSTLSSAAGSSLLYGLPSQMLSGVLSDFLRNEFGFIRGAEIIYRGGSLQESADLRLSGELGRAYWRFGGRIFNDIGNANISFQVSMGEILSSPGLRNLFIELERKVEGAQLAEERKLTNTARLFWKFSF
jgi:hypothetical protein